MGGQTEVVRCRDVTGVLREITLHYLNEFLSPGSVLEHRLVRVNGRVYVRKFVSRKAGSLNPRRYDLLDNEIRAGTRLGQAFPDRFPPELARLVAYNIDVDEPFVLLHEYIGEPAASVAGQFDDSQRRQFEQGLLRALQLTGVAGVVHGAVSMQGVRWHDGQLQLVDFECAQRAGEPRRGGCGSAAHSPEQAAGTGQVDVRDDMWAAGLLIRRLHVGASPDGARPDRGRDPARLRALLDPVFDNPLEQRPYPADLLSRMRAENHIAVFTDPDAKFEVGRDLFEQISKGKREPAAAVTTLPQGSRSSSWVKRLLVFLAAMAVVTTVIVGTVLLK